MDNTKAQKRPKEVAVIFSKYETEEGLTIYRPIDLRIGYLDTTTNQFITKKDSYNHMADPYCEYGFGLRSTLKDFREKFQLEDFTLKDAGLFCLSSLQDYEFYFFTQEIENGIALRFAMENIHTKDVKYVYETDIEMALIYLAESIIKNNEEYFKKTDESLTETTNEKDIKFDFDAKKLSDEVKKNIIGQDNAVDDIISIIWQNQKSDVKSNILLVGPSGVGKTEIIRNLTSKLNIPMAKVNITDVSQTGYVGTCLNEAIKLLVRNANNDIEKASNGIIFIDEIDKKAGSGEYNTGVSTTGVQDELLKLLEDNDYEINISDNPNFPVMKTINTKNITFICAGAFTNMKEIKKLVSPKTAGFNPKKEEIKPNNNGKVSLNITKDDLVKYGLKKELVGRLHNIIELSQLNKEDLINIMKNPNNKNIKAKEKILESLGINLKLDDEVYELLAENALKNNTGARGLIGEVDKLFVKAMRDISFYPNDYEELIINKDTVINPNNYKLIKRKK